MNELLPGAIILSDGNLLKLFKSDSRLGVVFSGENPNLLVGIFCSLEGDEWASFLKRKMEVMPNEISE